MEKKSSGRKSRSRWGNKHATCHGEKQHCLVGVWHTDWEANVRTSCCQIYPTQVRRAFLIAEHLSCIWVRSSILGSFVWKKWFPACCAWTSRITRSLLMTRWELTRAGQILDLKRNPENRPIYFTHHTIVDSAVRDHNWWKGCSTIRTGTGGDNQSTLSVQDGFQVEK